MNEAEPRGKLSVATWNVLFRGSSELKLSYLDAAEWDVACLQEVNTEMSDALARQDDWMIVDGLRLVSGSLANRKRPHATALVARNGWSLGGGALMPDTPTPGRGVTALASGPDGVEVSVVSWHAPNKAGEGLATKMAGYRAAVAMIDSIEGPLVVGLDSNHWSLDTGLHPEPHDSSSGFAVENQFFAGDPQHRLHDALLVHLRENDEHYRRLLELRPDGPLEVTYKRGQTFDRFDYVMVSEDFAVASITHDYEGSVAAGSDHGLVSARLLF